MSICTAPPSNPPWASEWASERERERERESEREREEREREREWCGVGGAHRQRTYNTHVARFLALVLNSVVHT